MIIPQRETTMPGKGLPDLSAAGRIRSVCATLAVLLLCVSGASMADPLARSAGHTVDEAVLHALGRLGLERGSLAVSGLGKSLSPSARLALVDAVLQDPMRMAGLSRGLLNLHGHEGIGDYLSGIMTLLGVTGITTDTCNSTLTDLQEKDLLPGIPPPVDDILRRAMHARAAINKLQWPEPEGPGPVYKHISQAVRTHDARITSRLVVPDVYTSRGAGFEVGQATAALVELAACLEARLPDLHKLNSGDTGEWETPYGRVGISGSADDRHTGPWLLLIDLGGNDSYRDVGPPSEAGSVSIVIDLVGDDTVGWENTAGPGSGLLGLGIWIDVDGNDRYQGRNIGAGAGVFGAGLLWDRSGDDVYMAGSLSQGAGQYGTGILLDEAGDDRYIAEAASQGFGGSGGYGILLDLGGDDRYECGGVIPDSSGVRVRRHADSHYFSLCQGYGFGMRPVVSGGIGVLLDREGNDHYNADMFAQGAATWFGLGMLTDVSGDDSYRAFEHCQGEGLHAGTGILGDWAGNDSYEGYEHCQGTGVDASAGYLLDAQGDDSYRANRESQGAGVKPVGRGLLVDADGDDVYEAETSAQGYAAVLDKFPLSMQPIGLLLDLAGADRFLYPDFGAPTRQGRLQNQRGLAIDYQRIEEP